MKKYQIIYADPPWRFKYRHNKNDLSGHNEGFYPLMEIDEIKKLPIDKITEKNCALFLWVTDPLLDKGVEVLKTWGFVYKTVAFTWIKKNRDFTNWLGMGYYTRSNPEMCLLGVKGKMKRINADVRQLVEIIRKKHSSKPICIKNDILRLFGDLPRIELFAREKTEGWDVWGNEVESDININLEEV